MFPFFKARHPRPLLAKDEQEQVVTAIREAERATSGEVRVFMEPRCRFVDARDRAWEIFFKLEMERTKLRNAVLIYLATDDRQFAIVGDEGIYRQAGGQDYWKEAAATFRKYLKEQKLSEGLCVAIREIGNTLSVHFPYDAATDKNELPDEIVFGR